MTIMSPIRTEQCSGAHLATQSVSRHCRKYRIRTVSVYFRFQCLDFTIFLERNP